jgi:hypothetical protein
VLISGRFCIAGEVTELQFVVTSIDAGQFAAAEKAISAALAVSAFDSSSRQEFLFQRERMRRILLDFSQTEDDVKARLRKQIPDLSDADFASFEQRGFLEHQVIDGSVLYFNRSASNLFRLSDEALARRREQTPLSDSPMQSPNSHHRSLRSIAEDEGRAGVAPHRVRVTQSLSVKANAVPAGEVIRAWIPVPRVIPGHQEDIRFLSSEPAVERIAAESVLQRTAYFEQRATADQATDFSIQYELTIYGQYHAVVPRDVVPGEIAAELVEFVGERPPHIVFTNGIQVFSEQVVGDETNPWRIAQKLFAAVDRIPWAGAREYSTISNISDYALHAGHADCGQQTLLLMTLLRLNGIPTRWQSGMMFSGGGYGEYWNLHDWGQLYIEPYGWLPMDVTFGRFPGEPALEWFYLGGLDAYRIAFNDDFGTSFDPPKQHFRSDTVDSQRGEAEWAGGNLYFDQWDYAFEVEIMTEPASSAGANETNALRMDVSRRGI